MGNGENDNFLHSLLLPNNKQPRLGLSTAVDMTLPLAGHLNFLTVQGFICSDIGEGGEKGLEGEVVGVSNICPVRGLVPRTLTTDYNLTGL